MNVLLNSHKVNSYENQFKKDVVMNNPYVQVNPPEQHYNPFSSVEKYTKNPVEVNKNGKLNTNM